MDTELIRLVRMTLHPDRVKAFLVIFDDAAPQIRATPGCLHLELWQDERYPNVVSTYSRWESPQALEAYRTGSYFRETWRRTRRLFAAPPEAYSHHRVRSGGMHPKDTQS